MRPPDEVIGTDYLLRWWLVNRRWLGIYLHKFVGHDSGRDQHDHPAWNLTIVLWNRYWEETLTGSRFVVRWLLFRRASHVHRIYKVDAPCWTLWIRGPRVRKWGFYVQQEDGTRRWVPHEEYVK